MTRNEYLDVYYRTEGSQEIKFRAVLHAYANPPKKLLHPSTWLSNRTWRAVILEVLAKTQNPGSFQALLVLLSVAFSTGKRRKQIKLEGDFHAALTALIHAVPELKLNRFPSNEPFCTLREFPVLPDSSNPGSPNRVCNQQMPSSMTMRSISADRVRQLEKYWNIPLNNGSQGTLLGVLL